MALSLGVKQGMQIKIGDSVLEVLEVMSAANIVVYINGEEYLITDKQRTEVLPEVFISAGRNDDPRYPQASYTRIAIEAPRKIKINRLPHSG